MKVEAKVLREGPVDLEINATPEELELIDEEYRFLDPVHGRVNYQLIGDRVISKGQVSTIITSQCGRCLADVRVPLTAIVDAVYENDEELLKPERKAFGSEDQIITYFDGEAVHPEPELRESLMLELPTLPLCKEDCKGLCPDCGANLNEGPCNCGGKQETATGWKAALKEIKLP